MKNVPLDGVHVKYLRRAGRPSSRSTTRRLSTAWCCRRSCAPRPRHHRHAPDLLGEVADPGERARPRGRCRQGVDGDDEHSPHGGPRRRRGGLRCRADDSAPQVAGSIPAYDRAPNAALACCPPGPAPRRRGRGRWLARQWDTWNPSHLGRRRHGDAWLTPRRRAGPGGAPAPTRPCRNTNNQAESGNLRMQKLHDKVSEPGPPQPHRQPSLPARLPRRGARHRRRSRRGVPRRSRRALHVRSPPLLTARPGTDRRVRDVNSCICTGRRFPRLLPWRPCTDGRRPFAVSAADVSP